MNGTGSMLAHHTDQIVGRMGRPIPMPTGMAPRSSMRGSIEIKNTMR